MLHKVSLLSPLPFNLRSLPGIPNTIYIKGSIKPSDTKAVAIIGSREMTSYGKKVAVNFSRTLARSGITVVSGLARGIDTVAHREALKSGGRTIAVLGSGLDIIYPPENIALAGAIARRGALISQFPPGTKPLGKNFLQRNCLISGLSLAVVVIEGKRQSGTLSTASYAASQGREVFAVPGPVDSPLSQAPHFLIENGAAIAKSPKDVLDYIETII